MFEYLTLLRTRPHYRYLWLASVVSMLGDWFNAIATVILVNKYTDSGTAVGALFLARSLPPFLLGPLAGVIADRFNRKSILILTDLSRAVIVIGFLFVNSPERAWLIYALSIAQFMVSAFFEPARAAIMPSVVEGNNELLLANTLSSATWSAMLAFGAAIGGFTAAVFGAPTALVIDALSFLLSAGLATLVVLPVGAVGTTGSHAASGWRDLIDGFAYVQQNPQIGLFACVKALGQVGSADIITAVYAARVFTYGQDGATALGLMFAFSGIGAVLGPVLGNYFSDGSDKALQRLTGVGFLFLSLGWFLIGWSATFSGSATLGGLLAFPLVLLGFTIRFMGGAANWTYSSVLLQLKVPDRFLGRVFALDFTIFTLALSLAVWLTGVALDKTSLTAPQISLVLSGGSLIPFFIWLVATRLVNSAP